VNLLIVAIMLSRPLGRKDLERKLGLAVVACALPVGLAVVLNALGGREWWAVVLPLLYSCTLESSFSWTMCCASSFEKLGGLGHIS
jgi:hypothetical protein